MKKILFALILMSAGAAFAQTPPVVWSCLSNCSATSNTYNDGAFRALTPIPTYVAATTGTNTNCSVNWWNTSGAVRWRLTSTLAGNSCVSIRTGNVESFASASSLWPAAPPPTPVNCVVSEWGDWIPGSWGVCSNGQHSRTEMRVRTVTTQPANGGAACPVLNETRTVTESCQVPQVMITVERTVIYAGDVARIKWVSVGGLTACTASWTSEPFPATQDTFIDVGPLTVGGTTNLGLSCTGPDGTDGDVAVITVRNPQPGVLVHLDDLLAFRVKWWPLETSGTGYDLKVTYFTAQGQETWATTWVAVRARAASEYAGVPYDEAAARAECEINCRWIDPTSPLGVELAAWRDSVTPAERAAMGIVE